MDKLETFFIRTVAAAQQQAQTTSGAVSTTKIGDFLTQQTVTEDILDKLVSASVSQESPAEPPTTEKVIPVESSEPEPAEQLLNKLTASTEQIQPEASVTNEQITTQPVEAKPPQQDQVNESILDRLTGRKSTEGQDEEPTDKSQAGDVVDA
jgi:hypothetical protein